MNMKYISSAFSLHLDVYAALISPAVLYQTLHPLVLIAQCLTLQIKIRPFKDERAYCAGQNKCNDH